MSDGGKGCAPRPIPNYKQYTENWDAIFKKKVQPDPARQIRSTSEEGCNRLDTDEVGLEMCRKP